MKRNRSSIAAVVLLVCVVAPVFAIDLWIADRPGYLYSVPDVEPVGWSRDGHFAYRLSRPLAGVGGTRWEFAIVNAVTDEVVFFERFDDTAEPRASEVEESPGRLDAVQRSFVDALGRYAIVPDRGIVFRPFPIETEDGRYTVEVETECALVERTPMDYVESWVVRVVRESASGGRTSKRITGGDEIRAASLVPLGAFTSPYEPRMLVVIGREAYVFEGTEAFYLFSGAHLTYGFE